jgi:hypothetical protein
MKDLKGYCMKKEGREFRNGQGCFSVVTAEYKAACSILFY